MELVAAEMRALASVAYPLLSELTESVEAGERLMAVSILEMIAHPDWLDWLAERVHKEKPFVAYHGAVALITAVRVLGTHYTQEGCTPRFNTPFKRVIYGEPTGRMFSRMR